MQIGNCKPWIGMCFTAQKSESCVSKQTDGHGDDISTQYLSKPNRSAVNTINQLMF